MPATIPSRSDSASPVVQVSASSPPPEAARPLRVLTFLNSLAPGGVERVALRLHTAWLGAGVDSRLVLADGSVGVSVPANVRVLGSRHGGFGRFATLLLALPGLISAERPDIVFCAGNTYAAVAVCLKLLLGRRCPVIVAKISNDLVRADMSPPLRWLYRRWLWLQGRCIDRFVGMAPAMRDEISALTGVPAERVCIIEDPALSEEDRDRLVAARNARQARTGRHFIAVGRLVAQKNFALLIEAFARIVRPGDTLTILGEGTERASLEASISRLGLGHAVALPGHVEPLDRWLAAADALVLSSDYEGVPAVVIEALAAGVPIVATDCCVSMRELLGHGQLGRIVPVGDAAALALAMATGVELPCAAHARRAGANRFTIERASDRYVGLMRSMMLDAGKTAASTPTA